MARKDFEKIEGGAALLRKYDRAEAKKPHFNLLLAEGSVEPQ